VTDMGTSLLRMGAVTMGTITALSLLMAMVVTCKLPLPARITHTLSVTFSLVVANTFVAFGGCAAVSVITSSLR